MNKKVVEAEAFMDQLELVYNIEITFYRLMKAKQDVIATSQAVERLAEGVRSAQAFLMDNWCLMWMCSRPRWTWRMPLRTWALQKTM